MTLPSIQSTNNNIGLLELDLAPKLAAELGLDLNLSDNVELVKDLLQQMGKIGAEHLTGLVLDPIYSFGVVKNQGKAGILMRLTTLHEEIDPLAIPSLIPNYGLEELRNNYNMACLELYYHPEEEQALKKKQLLAEVHDYCDYLDINLLLKLIVYTPADEEFTPEAFQEDQLTAIQELRGSTDVIALQCPVDALAVATITAELDIPWIFANYNHAYEEFKQELRICLENGAVGFMAGYALCQDLKKFKLEDNSPDLEKIIQFINTTFKDRVIELMRIVEENRK
jgi:tagatose-1,6-bisphosphate aldolase